jgi:hypothetical protein
MTVEQRIFDKNSNLVETTHIKPGKAEYLVFNQVDVNSHPVHTQIEVNITAICIRDDSSGVLIVNHEDIKWFTGRQKPFIPIMINGELGLVE